jgi:hypothetical protein
MIRFEHYKIGVFLHVASMCFVRFSQVTVIISLNGINCLDLVLGGAAFMKLFLGLKPTLVCSSSLMWLIS